MSKGIKSGTIANEGHGFHANDAVILAVLLIASMTTFMGGAAVAPALPHMSEAFPAASPTAISTVITLPGLAVIVTGFFVGAFADRVGKVRTLAIAAIIFFVAGSAPLYLTSFEAILASRVVLGVGIAGISVSTTGLISDYFTGNALAKALSLQSAAMGAGVLLLETSGGLLAEFGWRPPFFLYGLGLVILLGIAFVLREPRSSGGSNAHENASEGEATAASADAPAPSLAWRIVLPAVIGGALCIFLQNIITFTLPGRLPFYIEEAGSTSAISGLLLGLHGLSMTIFSLMQAKIASKLSRSTLLIICFSSMFVGLIVLWFAPSVIMAVVSVVVTGVGVGLMIPTVLQWMTSVATPRTSGKITGCFTAATNLGQFSCSLLMAPVLVAVGGSAGLFGLAAISALAVVVILLVVKLSEIVRGREN